MSKSQDKEMEQTKRIMGALVRMPPKPHDEMKLGKRKASRAKTTKRKPKKREPAS